MKYFIQGEYPRYTITAYREQELVRVDHAVDMKQIMTSFIHRLQPGDTIEWLEPELAPPAGAWWLEQDGAMPR